jgi:hypothetical protein
MMNERKELMRLFGRVKNDLRTIGQTRLDRLQRRLLNDALETQSLIEFRVLVKPHLTEETSNDERTQASGGH